ncbi:MAG: hypothetical protein DMG60_17415, partial [Acidobacteria bacterium]
MAKRMLLMLIVAAAAIGGLGYFKLRQVQAAVKSHAFTPPPEAITTIVVKQETWPSTLSVVGTLNAIHGVTVSADLPGTVDQIKFDSGKWVQEGEVLVQLDTRQERAQLAAMKAQQDLAKINYDRMQQLVNEGVISRMDYDKAMADQRQTEANTAEIKAAIDRKTIRAPFSGALGIRQVNLGQYLAAGSPIVPLQSLDPIYVNFNVPQQIVGRMQAGRNVRISSDNLPGTTFTGLVNAVDSVVDQSTRNVQVQATLANPGGKLRPGMFVQVEVGVGEQRTVFPLPASAISYAPFGDSVFVLSDLKSPTGETYRGVRQQFVKVEGARGDQVGVISVVILIAGLQAIRSLSVRQYPRSDIAVVQVSTVYVGANADLVRGFITTPLERVIASADGIDYMESSSAQGVSTITVHLKLNYDTNAALTQVQAKVAQVRNDLPPEAEAPVIDLQTADTQFASMYLGFSSSDLDQNQITDYLTRVVQPKLSAINGVQRADILGKRTFAMRVWLKPEKMAALGITPSAVHDALANNNYLSALGRTKGSMVSVNLVANTDLRTAEEFRQLVVKQDKGTIVRLGEIADVVLGAETYDEDVRFNGESATFMGVWVLPTANSLEVIKNVRDAIPGIRAQLPVGMKVGIPYDSTAYIQDAIREVLSTLTETLLIVVVVIFLFLGSFRSVLIPVIAIPVSLIGAVFLMLVAGFTINLLTLLAIVLSVGLVVDDAIVMVENVERHLHEGKTPFRAAIDAARELVGPIIAMTVTLAAVYAPVGIQGGLTGALFREFAFTLAGAVIISGIVALTLSPMMGSKLLRTGDTERGFAGWINRRFESVRRLYERALASTLRYRPVVFGVWVIVALLVVPFYIFSQRELAPAEDQGVVFGVLQASPNSTLDQTKLFASQVYDVYHAFPEAESIFQITDPTGGFGGMVTKPWSERHKTAQQLLIQSTGPLSKIAGVRVIPLTPPPLPGGGNFPVDFVIASAAEPQQLAQFANELVKRAFQSGMFIYADSDLKFDQPQAEVVFDRDKLRSQGVDLSQAGKDLSTLLGGNYVNRFSIQGQ